MKRLPVGEILSYLLPGMIGIILIWLGVGNENLEKVVPSSFLSNPIAAFLFPTVAFFLGIISSSLMHFLEKYIIFRFLVNDPLESIHLSRFKGTILNAFNQLTGYHGSWSKEHFYIARALVREKASVSAIESSKQSFFRQFRRNSFVFIVAFFILFDVKVYNAMEFWLLAILIFLEVIFVGYFLYTGIILNRKREVNEVSAGVVTLVDKLSEGRILSSKLDYFLFHGKSFSKNELIELINKYFDNDTLELILSGFPSMGKTTCSKVFVDSSKKKVHHIEAESWFKSLDDRKKSEFSGAAFESYQGSESVNDLDMFLNGQEIEFKEYDHSKGKCVEAKKKQYNTGESYILDGTIFSHFTYSKYSKLTLFFIPKDYNRWLELAIKRDVTKRGYDDKESLEHNERKFKDILNLYINQSKGCIPVLVDQTDEHNFMYIPTAGFFNGH
ncbi:MAG: hypothetical protein MK008_09635 [Bdellovibrionales bacterium]|nr:hypothetical protein [Bdellovibrionales bacterium]